MTKTPFIFAAAAIASLSVNVFAADKNGNKIPKADGSAPDPLDPSLYSVKLSNAEGETAAVAGNVITPGDSVDGASFEVDVALLSDATVICSTDVVLTGEATSLVAEVVAVPVPPPVAPPA